jgi:hypothetical protein
MAGLEEGGGRDTVGYVLNETEGFKGSKPEKIPPGCSRQFPPVTTMKTWVWFIVEFW